MVLAEVKLGKIGAAPTLIEPNGALQRLVEHERVAVELPGGESVGPHELPNRRAKRVLAARECVSEPASPLTLLTPAGPAFVRTSTLPPTNETLEMRGKRARCRSPFFRRRGTRHLS